MRRAVVVGLVACACGPSYGSLEQTRPPDEVPPPVVAPAPSSAPVPKARLEIVAEHHRRFTGVAITPGGAVFVNFPRWSSEVPISVARFDASGKPQPFPDAAWNGWKTGDRADTAWVCVQSVRVDTQGRLWVLDPGNPAFAGVVKGAPKLVRFDLPDTKPKQTIRFRDPVITDASYLNDVRLDLKHQVAYLTDSGDGALVVTDLNSGRSRRVLDGAKVTAAEATTLTIGGKTFDRKVNADGIAYDPTGDVVYFQPLTGRTLYRIPAAALRAALADEEAAKDLEAKVETVATSGASDGLEWHDGKVWVSALEKDAILTVTPTGEVETVVHDPRIAWPDSFAVANGKVHFTTAQIHLGDAVTEPFRVWRILPP